MEQKVGTKLQETLFLLAKHNFKAQYNNKDVNVTKLSIINKPDKIIIGYSEGIDKIFIAGEFIEYNNKLVVDEEGMMIWQQQENLHFEDGTRVSILNIA